MGKVGEVVINHVIREKRIILINGKTKYGLIEKSKENNKNRMRNKKIDPDK